MSNLCKSNCEVQRERIDEITKSSRFIVNVCYQRLVAQSSFSYWNFFVSIAFTLSGTSTKGTPPGDAKCVREILGRQK